MNSSADLAADTYRRCEDCGAIFPSWHTRHRARTCAGYAEMWAKDQQVKLFAALQAYEEMVPSGVKDVRVRLLAVTAPGVDAGLIWDEELCAHLGPHKHSGMLGCRVVEEVAAIWNENAPKWWRELHHEASQATRRKTGITPVLLARVWEKQKRGLLHVHPVLGASTLAEKIAAETYARELARLAAEHGFGFSERKERLLDGKAAAAYLSSYFVAGKKGKQSLQESVQDREMPASIVYVAPALSQRSGVTMRTLRWKRYLWRLWGDVLRVLLEEGFKLSELVRAREVDLTPMDLIRGYVMAQAP